MKKLLIILLLLFFCSYAAAYPDYGSQFVCSCTGTCMSEPYKVVVKNPIEGEIYDQNGNPVNPDNFKVILTGGGHTGNMNGKWGVVGRSFTLSYQHYVLQIYDKNGALWTAFCLDYSRDNPMPSCGGIPGCQNDKRLAFRDEGPEINDLILFDNLSAPGEVASFEELRSFSTWNSGTYLAVCNYGFWDVNDPGVYRCPADEGVGDSYNLGYNYNVFVENTGFNFMYERSRCQNNRCSSFTNFELDSCSSGTYKDGTNCKPCPNGSTSALGSTSATQCYYKAGVKYTDSTGTFTVSADCYNM